MREKLIAEGYVSKKKDLLEESSKTDSKPVSKELSISVPEEVEMNPIGKIATASIDRKDESGRIAMLSPTGVTIPMEAVP